MAKRTNDANSAQRDKGGIPEVISRRYVELSLIKFPDGFFKEFLVEFISTDPWINSNVEVHIRFVAVSFQDPFVDL